MTMLEKMARAMIAASGVDMSDMERSPGAEGAGDVTDVPVEGRADFMAMARAALLAIREPTGAEVMGALREDSAVRANTVRREFTAMIDAILNETGETKA